MNTKEAIRYIKLCKLEDGSSDGKDYTDIIALLQQGEKYRKMWEEFKEIYGAQSIVLEGKLQNLEDKMDWFEQKYFPKEESKNERSKI